MAAPACPPPPKAIGRNACMRVCGDGGGWMQELMSAGKAAKKTVGKKKGGKKKGSKKKKK